MEFIFCVFSTPLLTVTHTQKVTVAELTCSFCFFPVCFFFRCCCHRTLEGNYNRWRCDDILFFSMCFSLGWHFRQLPIHDGTISREIPKPNEFKRFKGFFFSPMKIVLYYFQVINLHISRDELFLNFKSNHATDISMGTGLETIASREPYQFLMISPKRFSFTLFSHFLWSSLCFRPVSEVRF